MMSNKPEAPGVLNYFLKVLLLSLLAAALAWYFGITLATRYSDGILLYPPVANEPPEVSDAFYTGMALGATFALLIYILIGACFYTLGKFGIVHASKTTAAFLTSALICLVMILVFIRLAG
ncbi:MAG: hypothetical protein RQ899_11845 [Pseudomonadales bacterium]|nr:hypothetical protein [Pseudomonadales bacterium]